MQKLFCFVVNASFYVQYYVTHGKNENFHQHFKTRQMQKMNRKGTRIPTNPAQQARNASPATQDSSEPNDIYQQALLIERQNQVLNALAARRADVATSSTTNLNLMQHSPLSDSYLLTSLLGGSGQGTGRIPAHSMHYQEALHNGLASADQQSGRQLAPNGSAPVEPRVGSPQEGSVALQDLLATGQTANRIHGLAAMNPLHHLQLTSLHSHFPTGVQGVRHQHHADLGALVSLANQQDALLPSAGVAATAAILSIQQQHQDQQLQEQQRIAAIIGSQQGSINRHDPLALGDFLHQSRGSAPFDLHNSTRMRTELERQQRGTSASIYGLLPPLHTTLANSNPTLRSTCQPMSPRRVHQTTPAIGIDRADGDRQLQLVRSRSVQSTTNRRVSPQQLASQSKTELRNSNDISSSLTKNNKGDSGQEKTHSAAELCKSEDCIMQSGCRQSGESENKEEQPGCTEDIGQRRQSGNIDGVSAVSTKRGLMEPFPEKLHRLLIETAEAGMDDIISFTPDGKSFEIHKPDRFFHEIVPKYFKQSRLSSFKRQLNLYGFELISAGQSRGGYYHELFQRDSPDLCRQIRRRDIRFNSRLKSSRFETNAPDFYSMPPIISSKEAKAIAADSTTRKHEVHEAAADSADSSSTAGTVAVSKRPTTS